MFPRIRTINHVHVKRSTNTSTNIHTTANTNANTDANTNNNVSINSQTDTDHSNTIGRTDYIALLIRIEH